MYWHYQAAFERNLEVFFNNTWWVKFSLSGGNKDNIRAGCKKCGYRKSVISNMNSQCFLPFMMLVGTAFWGEGEKRKEIFSLLAQTFVSLNYHIVLFISCSFSSFSHLSMLIEFLRKKKIGYYFIHTTFQCNYLIKFELKAPSLIHTDMSTCASSESYCKAADISVQSNSPEKIV